MIAMPNRLLFSLCAGLLLGVATAPLVVARELSTDLLYDILVAEVAMQRDQPLTAFTHYQAAARRSGDVQLAELAVRAALAAEIPQQATQAIEEWIALAPDSLRARRLAAYIALDQHDQQQALAQLQQVIALSSSRRQGYSQAARLLGRLDDPEQRLELMRQVIGDDLEDADALMALATLAVGADQEQQAQHYAEQAAAIRPAWAQPQLFLVRRLVAQDQEAAALTRLTHYFEQGFDDDELRILYAKLLVKAGEIDAARDSFATLLATRPDFAGGLFAAAALSMQLEDTDAARDYLLRLRATGEHQQEATFLLGQVEQMAGNLAAARSWYARVRGEQEHDAQVRIAALYAEEGEMARARERLEQLRRQLPDAQEALYLIEAELLRKHQQPDQAMDIYNHALAQSPDSPDLLYSRALLGAQMQRVDILEHDLRRVLEMHPDHADALNALGYTLADQTDRLDEARELIEQALALEPEQPAILDSMGWVLYRLGKPEQALPYLQRAHDAMLDGEIAAHLGEVLWALGRETEAREVWQQAFDANPEHEYLLQVLERHAVSLSPADL